jgi:hypothetical protein
MGFFANFLAYALRAAVASIRECNGYHPIYLQRHFII